MASSGLMRRLRSIGPESSVPEGCAPYRGLTDAIAKASEGEAFTLPNICIATSAGDDENYVTRPTAAAIRTALAPSRWPAWRYAI